MAPHGSTRQIPAYCSFIDPERMKGRVQVSWPGWLTCSARFTHSNGHPSSTGRAQDRETSPARDRRSTTVLRNQLLEPHLYNNYATGSAGVTLPGCWRRNEPCVCWMGVQIVPWKGAIFWRK